MPPSNMIALALACALVCATVAVTTWAILRDHDAPNVDPPPFYSELLAKERYRAQAAWGVAFKAREETGRLGMRIHNQRKRIAELQRKLEELSRNQESDGARIGMPERPTANGDRTWISGDESQPAISPSRCPDCDQDAGRLCPRHSDAGGRSV